MMKSTVRPLQTLLKLVGTNVFEKLLEPKTVFRQGTGCHKVRRGYRRFRQKWVPPASQSFQRPDDELLSCVHF